MVRRFLALAGLLVVAAASLAAQYGTTNGEWRSYAGDPGSTKYSPLDQINKDNAKNLRIAWRFKTDNYGPRPDYNMQVTPLVVNGVMYAQAGVRRAVVAHRSRDGRTVVGVADGRRQARGERAAPGIGTRRRLLDRWQRGRAYSHGHAWLPARRAECEDRCARSNVRTQRHRRSQDRARPAGYRFGYCRYRPQRAAGCRQQRRRHRRRAHTGKRTAHEGKRQGLRPRLRRPHRQASVDFPHDSAAG